MSKHTKGPWYWTGSGGLEPVNMPESRNIAVILNSDGCLVYRDAADGWDDEQAANLALIAAAPDLLDALREVVAVFESNPESITDTVWVTGDRPETLYDCCRAAIAKAKGEK